MLLTLRVHVMFRKTRTSQQKSYWLYTFCVCLHNLTSEETGSQCRWTS